MSGAVIILMVAAVTLRGEAIEVESNRHPPKCCPKGQILNSTLDCESSKSDELVIPTEVPNSYPDCPRENITLKEAVEGNHIICLDKMHTSDNSVRDSTKLIGLTCDNVSLSDIFEVPRVVSIKKCCPIERKYNNYTMGCWSKDVISDYNTFDKLLGSLLNHTDLPSYVDITFGAPICESDEVLVDYRIPKYQVLQLESEAIRMRIPGHSEYIILPPESICVDIDGHDDLTIIVRACQNENLICKLQRKTCVRKCCPDGQSMFYNNTCVPSKREFNPKFYSNVNTRHVKLLKDNELYPSLAYGRKCENIYLLEPWNYEEDVCFLDTNGKLYSPFLNKYYDRNSYCIEFLSSTKYNVSGLVTFACFPEIYEHMSNYTSSFFFVAGSGAIISSFFLTLTLIVYACLPNLQNIHGKTIMCYIFSLLIAYICLSVNQIGSLLFNIMKDERQCRTLGYALMFSFLAAFSWLNVLCFDIWYTFGSVRSSFERRKTSTRSHRFLYYNMYSWGFAGTVTSITMATDYAAKLGYLTHVWVSDIGITTCWFSKMTKGIILYFILPAGIQMVFNLFLFILTTRHYLKVKCAIAKMHNNIGAKQRYNTDKKKFIMAFKLFIVMGISWIPEMLSHIIDPASGWWLFTDLLNVMHGLLIFLLLVFKRTIIKGIVNRSKEILPCFKKNKTSQKTRSSSSTIFTTISSECKLSSVRQK